MVSLVHPVWSVGFMGSTKSMRLWFVGENGWEASVEYLKSVKSSLYISY